MNNNESNMREDLKREDHEEEHRLPSLPQGMEEGPACPHQNDDGEEQNDTKEVKDEKRDVIPSVRNAGEVGVVFDRSGKEKGESFGEEERGHEEVDAVKKGVIADLAEIEPEGEEGEVKDGEKEEERREEGVAGGEVVAGTVAVEGEKLGVEFHGDGTLGVAVSEE